MWVVLKLLAFIVTFNYKKLFKRRLTGDAELVNNTLIYRNVTIRNRSTYFTDFNVEFYSPYFFKLTREAWYDKVFKFLGLAIESQTGDRDFDRKVYVDCDDRRLYKILRHDIRIRKAILDLFSTNCHSITHFGDFMRVRFKDERFFSQKISEALVEVCELLQMSERQAPHSQKLKNFFSHPALYVEATIWGLAAYAWLGMIEAIVVRGSTTLHLDINLLFGKSILCSILVGISLFLFSIIFLAGSSRSHRVLVESFFMILLSVPMSGYCLVVDLNRALDRSSVRNIEVPVSQLEVRELRVRRGFKGYLYLVHIDSPSLLSEFPELKYIKVKRDVYQSIVKGSAIPISIREGWLGIPYLVSVNGWQY